LIGLVAVAIAGPAVAVVERDALVCFTDPEGRPVRIGDPVVTPDGREVGWVSAMQCASDASPERLRVTRAAYPYQVLEIDRRSVA
jgi:hypothetical protein